MRYELCLTKAPSFLGIYSESRRATRGTFPTFVRWAVNGMSSSSTCHF